MTHPSRRGALVAAAGAALMLPACKPKAGGGGEEVSPVEDLMREHGVLRRVLVVYRETAAMIRSGAAGLDLAALGEAAAVFREFGEAYHEQTLEEQHLFPAVEKLGGKAGALVPVLKAQHDRGGEITGFIQARAAAGGGDQAPLATALEAFARMYEPHAALEDTVVFQAWKDSLNEGQLKEAGEQFEEIEKARFKGDGFDKAVERVAAVEQRLGLADLSRYTASAPV